METLKLEPEHKLTIEHLSPYLPYRLHIQLEGKIKELIGLESPYKTNNNFFIRGEVREIGGTYRQTHSMRLTEKTAHLCKPLLLPLSELTDEQWTFLFLKCMDYVVSENHRIYRNSNYVILYHGELNDMTEMPSISKTICSYTFSEQMFSGTGFSRFNQIIGFNELYRLHADVFGLLDKGLAISKV